MRVGNNREHLESANQNGWINADTKSGMFRIERHSVKFPGRALLHFSAQRSGDLHAIAWIHAQISEKFGRPRRFNHLLYGDMIVHGGL
jgi:hypothetical protein